MRESVMAEKSSVGVPPHQDAQVVASAPCGRRMQGELTPPSMSATGGRRYRKTHMWKCENDLRNRGTTPEVVAVCISPGGVPKTVMDSAEVTVDGLVGDGHDHEKHARPHRALTIQDIELLTELEAEGFDVGPGIMGENLTVRGLHVQQMSPGDQLVFENGPLIELTEVRRPCFVLDKVHPELKRAVVGRCGFLARVLKTGRFFSGQRIHVNENKHETENKKIHKQVNAAGEYSARSPSPRITIRGRQTQSPHVFTIKGAAHG